MIAFGITSNTLQAGGAEVQRITLANGLLKAGRSVALITLQQEGVLADRLSAAVELNRSRYFLPFGRKIDLLITGTTRTELTFGLLNRIAGQAHRWLVAVHNPVGEAAPPLDLGCISLMRAADCIVGLTPDHEAAISTAWKVRTHGWISNEVDLSWTSDVVRMREQTSAFPYIAGHLGRVAIRHKGLDRVCAAWAQRGPDSGKLVIYGDGEVSALTSMLRRQSLLESVDIPGYANPRSALATFEVYVCLSRYEGQPISLIEALACGVPTVVSSEVPLTAQQRGRVIIVDGDDPAAVNRAIDEARYQNVERDTPRTVEPANMIAKYLAAADEVLNTRWSRRHRLTIGNHPEG